MALEGLDPEVVTQLAGQLKTQSQDIGGVIAHVDGIVNRIDQAWNGHTAAEFAGWWRQQHRPALVEAQLAVDGLHQSALNNVAQQEQASGDDSGGAVSLLGLEVGLGVAGGGAIAADLRALQGLGPEAGAFIGRVAPFFHFGLDLNTIRNGLMHGVDAVPGLPKFLEDLPGIGKGVGWLNGSPIAKAIPFAGSVLGLPGLLHDIQSPQYPGTGVGGFAWNGLNVVGDVAGMVPVPIVQAGGLVVHLSEGLVNSDLYQSTVQPWWNQNIGNLPDLSRGWNTLTSHPGQFVGVLGGDMGRGAGTLFHGAEQAGGGLVHGAVDAGGWLWNHVTGHG